MTSHHDVAVVVARAKTKAALLRMGEPVAYGSDAAAIEDLLVIVESQAKALNEWKQAAGVEAGLRREFYDRALAAEGRLAEFKTDAMKVIERLTPSHRAPGCWCSCSRDIDRSGHEVACAAARAFTNAAKEKT